MVAGAVSSAVASVVAAQSPAADSLHRVSPGLARFVPAVPTPASFVADVPYVLNAAAHDSIDAAIRSAQSSGLGDIAVAILPSIDAYAPLMSGLRSIERGAWAHRNYR
jgi:hypothetical protein